MAAIPSRARQLMQPHLRALEPYDPDFAPTRVNLSANENDFGMPEAVRAEVVSALAATPTNRYPDPLSRRLREAIASWHGVPEHGVIVGNGADELLYNFLLAFGGAGRVLLNCPPTFSEYAFFASLTQTAVDDVWRDPQTMLPPAEELVEHAAAADLVVVTSPNNPTGDLAGLPLVRRLAGACRGLVMVDEAYGEFAPAGTSAASLLPSCPNLVVLHTLSKAFSMAGARCGYALAAPDVVAALEAVRQLYSVNVLTQAAAQVAVERREAFRPVVAAIASERARLLGGLRALSPQLPVTVWPSEANFLLVRVPNASRVRARLRDERSVLVRDFSYAPGLEDCLRITVGTPEENDLVLDALATFVKEEA